VWLVVAAPALQRAYTGRQARPRFSAEDAMRGEIAVGLVSMLALAVTSTAGLAAAPPTTRTVYVTVVDREGQAVPGLTAADFGLKEGGKEREIASVAPAAGKMRIALMLDETLAAQGGVRAAMVEFVERMCTAAEISLIVIGIRGETAVDFTSDPITLVSGIRNLSLEKDGRHSMVPEGVLEVARAFEKAKPARPVIVLIATERDQVTSEDPQTILTHLVRSRALFSVVSIGGDAALSTSAGSLNDMVAMSRIIDEGTRQSGGRAIQVIALTGFANAVRQVADDLSSQYLITYTLPDGVKPSDRLDVSLKRKGATLRAPTRIPREY
jgi:VWFA-related protein